MKKAIFTIFFTIFILFNFSNIYAEKLIYHEKRDGEIHIYEIQIDSMDVGYRIIAEAKLGDEIETQTLVVDTTFATLKWEYDNNKSETDVSARRDENIIYLTGTQKDNIVDKKFEIDSRPWHQFFPTDLEKFAKSEEEKIEFWAIGTSGPGNMKITDFEAKVKEEEKIEVGGKKILAEKIEVNMKGWKSRFWKGKYWYRKSDGRYIWCEDENCPKELVEEK